MTFPSLMDVLFIDPAEAGNLSSWPPFLGLLTKLSKNSHGSVVGEDPWDKGAFGLTHGLCKADNVSCHTRARPCEEILADSGALNSCRLDECMQDAEGSLRPWCAKNFRLVKTLHSNEHTQTSVELMRSQGGRGDEVVVKRMTNRWVKGSSHEFQQDRPLEKEQPWHDIAVLKHLNRVNFPYVCKMLGIFRDDRHTYIASQAATEGDLYTWCKRQPAPGRRREASMVPVVSQVFCAVRWLHELGIAHRDLSLENILLTRVGMGPSVVKLIDFAMGTVSRHCINEVRGKRSYQAPEMHIADVAYDAFSVDAFALGVVLYSLAAQDYPWMSTQDEQCEHFRLASELGIREFLQRRRHRKSKLRMTQVFSSAFTSLLEGLLQLQPEERSTLGESCFKKQATPGVGRSDVWEMSWLHDSVACW